MTRCGDAIQRATRTHARAFWAPDARLLRLSSDDGLALWEAVCEHELEGVVAKRLHERYLPGERSWVKVKNRDYWRYELEREGAIRSRRRSEPLLVR